jgi:lysophospholipase L1-like esterase
VKRHEVVPRALGGGTLRVLCLGASITYGYESSDGNGFRYELRKRLVEDGLEVNMIGSLSHGTMADNQVEGWIGLRIAEVAAKAELSLPSLPNVVCIHVGSKL